MDICMVDISAALDPIVDVDGLTEGGPGVHGSAKA
jgi:hypothetical protein